MKKKTICIFILVTIIFGFIFAFNLFPQQRKYPSGYHSKEDLFYRSSSIEEESIRVNRVDRTFTLNGYGLIQFIDTISFKNIGNDPINEFYLTHPAKDSDNLVHISAKTSSGNSLMVERSNNLIILENNSKFELITIYFDTPIYPEETHEIIISQSLKNMLQYTRVEQSSQITYEGFIFPLLPYIIEDATARAIPVESSTLDYYDWGEPGTGSVILYAFADIRFNLNATKIDPFMRNLGIYKDVRITFKSTTATKVEVENHIRDITVSPWGTLKIKERIHFRNIGVTNIKKISFYLPNIASNLYIYDYLGEIFGVSREKRNVEIDLQENRGVLTTNSELKLTIEYSLPLENYIQNNWFQQSLKLDLLITSFEYLTLNQKTNLYIEGGNNIEYINQNPEEIFLSSGMLKLSYTSDYITTLDNHLLEISYGLNLFKLSTRPLFFILIISIISTLAIILMKLSKSTPLEGIKKEKIPINEIREFCSLYEEKSALILENRNAEQKMKRRKISKKRYRNLVDRNKSRIKSIETEIEPFKKILSETNETFENLIKKIDVLEAERTTIKDSLNLLDARYKRGKLPSKAAYEKLFNDFKKRQKKVDRTIDKLIQSLRSYLI